MHIEMSRSNRSSLHEAEKEFFTRVIPIAAYISQQSAGKAKWLRRMNDPVGILPSLMIADILFQSSFGQHPVSLKRLKNKPSNNLSLIEAGKHWYGSSVEYRGKEYRAYKDLAAYSIDCSDYIALSGLYDKLLTESDLDTQIRVYATNKRSPNGYCARIKDMIQLYQLEEFDRWPERKKQLTL